MQFKEKAIWETHLRVLMTSDVNLEIILPA